MNKEKQGDLSGNSDRPNKSQVDFTAQLAAAIEAFKRLDRSSDLVEFPLLFELERKRLRFTQSSFEKSWELWKKQGGQQ